MRDFQKRKFYRFENEMFKIYCEPNCTQNATFFSSLTKKGAERYIKRIGDTLAHTWHPVTSIKPAEVVHSDRRNATCVFNPNGLKIELAWPWGYNRHVLLHEYAHYLIHVAQYHMDPAALKYRVSSHGPEFAGVFIALNVRFLKRNKERLLKLAKEHGVKVDMGLAQKIILNSEVKTIR